MWQRGIDRTDTLKAEETRLRWYGHILLMDGDKYGLEEGDAQDGRSWRRMVDNPNMAS